MAESPRTDFAVVGGGIVGACVAEELAARGASVVVLDAGEQPGHATNQAAGVAVPSLRYLSDPDFHAWLTAAKTRLDADVLRLEPEYGAFSVTRPILRALRAEHVEQFGDRLADPDLGRWLSAADVAETGLTLPAGRRYLMDERGLMVDGRRYLLAVRRRCLAEGVRWAQDSLVRYIDERPGEALAHTRTGVVRAERVVVAAGAWSSVAGLAEGTGIGPQRGQMVVLDADAEPSHILSSAFYLAPGVDGRVIVGATEENVGYDERVTAEGIARLLMFATAAMPDLGRARPVELRAGLRPVSASGKPVVGRVPGRERVYVAAGHAGHGLLSARATASGLAAGLLDDDWDALPYSLCPTEAVGA
ncbi:FAD-dependent oxidoreductase [Actinokineospora auranticolor]|uniref:Glycine oxidase n=1 Tax=Actinokineospora auranticolor TaxID=155976 RepID=A0A2S6GPD4_9PSEU|nr:FAD-dependent oxidoreductase [Actinokineospora auranticolor]PPK67094.1 glycine oxidase [Actinokineospora auranticolor]